MTWNKQTERFGPSGLEMSEDVGLNFLSESKFKSDISRHIIV